MANQLSGNLIVTEGAETGLNPPFVGNVIVVGSSADEKDCKSIIGFKSVIPTSTITGQAEDSTYPFTNALDFRDNTQYSPSASSGSVTIEFRQGAPVQFDYIGIAIHNGFEAGLSCILEAYINGTWEQVTTFSPVGANRTMCEYFDKVTADRQRLTLNFTSKLYIGAIYLGKAWVFERTPNIGFTPGNTNNVDQVTSFSSDTDQFIIGRRKKRGFEQSFAFGFIPFDGVDAFNTQYVQFMEHVKSGNKPFFMKWSIERQENMFGQHKSPNALTPPTYENNTSGTFTATMKGYN